MKTDCQIQLTHDDLKSDNVPFDTISPTVELDPLANIYFSKSMKFLILQYHSYYYGYFN